MVNKFKKSRWILCLCLALSMSVTGCFKPDSGDGIENQGSSNGEEEIIMEITQDEKDMLSSIYGQEERINDGRLIGTEIEALNQYRYAKEYLGEKYPGYEFELFNFFPKRLDTSETRSYFREKNMEGDDYYELLLEGNDGDYSVRDDFYWHLIGPAYDEEITARLQAAGLENFYLYTDAMSFLGAEVDGNTTAEELMGMGGMITINLHLFVDMPGVEGEDTDKVVQTAEQVLRDMNQYGAHDVCFGEGIVDAVKAGEKIKLHEGNYYVQFNTFDLIK